jgi:hypothetical protein
MCNMKIDVDTMSPFEWCVHVMRSVWHSRWSTFRIAIACSILYALIWDNPNRLARLQIANLPDFEYSAEVQTLRDEQRFGEALVVGDAGRTVLVGDDRQRLEREIEKTIEYQNSYLRKFKELIFGAISGEPHSLESCIGTITADFFVVGDLRDLAIQGTKQLVDGESDKLILALSALGVVTTFAPPEDIALSILKIAKKVGRMSEKMTADLFKVATRAERDTAELERIANDVYDIGRRASFGGAVRVVSDIDHPADLARVADFVRHYDDGAFVLHIAGREGAEIIVHDATELELEALRTAARKGDRGLAWLRVSAPRLLKPHFVVGIAKTVFSGRLLQAVRRGVADYLDPYGYWIIGGVLTWIVFELVLMKSRFASR